MEDSLNQNISLELLFKILPILMGTFYIVKFFVSDNTYKSSRYYLAFLFFLIASVEGFTIGIDFVTGRNALYLIPIFVASTLSFAPTIYLFVRNLINKNLEIENSLKLYYPAIVIGLLDLILFIIINMIQKDTMTFEIVYVMVWIVTLGGLVVGFIIQNIVLLARTFSLIKKYQSELGEYYSFEEGVSLKWVKVFMYGYVLFFVGLLITSIPGADDYIWYSFDIVLLAFIIYTGTSALKQYNIIQTIDALQIADSNSSENAAIFETVSEASSSDQIDKYKLIRSNLERVMLDDKPFLNSKLTIYDLAKSVSTNYKYLSQAINQEFNMNFANYINSYRIEEAKLHLMDKKTRNYKIEVISEMAGFNSKSAYNTAFKKFTGKTPSEFRDAALGI